MLVLDTSVCRPVLAKERPAGPACLVEQTTPPSVVCRVVVTPPPEVCPLSGETPVESLACRNPPVVSPVGPLKRALFVMCAPRVTT